MPQETCSCHGLRLKKKEERPCARCSGAAAQQEDDEQDRDGHAKGPQQDVAKLAFLLPAPLLQPFHTYLRARLSGYRRAASGVPGFLGAVGKFITPCAGLRGSETPRAWRGGRGKRRARRT